VTYHEASDFYGLVLSKVCQVPIISNRRDMGFKTGSHHNMAYKLFGKLFNAVITVSEAVEKEVIKQNWFQVDRIFTIYNGVDTKEYKSKDDIVRIKQSIGIGTTHPVVGMIANLRKIKGIRYFIEAASIISKKNSQVQFLIIGVDMNEPGCTKGEMELFAKDCNVDKNVRFLGKRTDIPDLISIMDIGVIASLSEGFSNAIIEYMASSKPVVATDVGGNREAVLQCETGLLVPPADSHALASAILSILEDKEAALRFGIAGRERVEEKFSLDVMLRKYENLFERVIMSKSSSH
jgi:glycosyltransferase involved in cell wall biosynthesis